MVFLCQGYFATSQAVPNVNQGKELEKNKCYTCHSQKSGLGDGNIIYTRADRKVKTLARLNTMVSTCNSELRLDLFPEDEADIAAYLNQQFYKLSK
ncbi:MAG: hypothetical protein JHC80_00295 [Polynucleobacter sp.]|nr:hypothetical protein [Polynucleobacter sp.]